MIILSGDRAAVVSTMANILGISQYYAEYSPVQKSEYIASLKAKGKHVLMVGDGINDAPALASAHVSLAPASAIDISQKAADMVFQGKSLASVIFSIKIAGYINILVKQNIVFSLLYNMAAIPVSIEGSAKGIWC